MSDESVHDMDNISNRKIRKPLMERKRRARINRSLDELYQLLTETDLTPKGAKLEKADILEMTVQYFKYVKQNSYGKEVQENLKNVMLERYQSGFERCAGEIETLLEPQLRHKVNWHLKNCLEKVKIQQKDRPMETSTKVVDVRPVNSCSLLIREPKDLKILPSKLPNGDVLLLLSSSSVKCEKSLNRSDVWRPWW